MMPLLQRSIRRSLDHIPQDTAEIWLFEDAKARRNAEALAAGQGRKLRIHSAYKPLLHAIVEQGLFATAARATIHYPVVKGCNEARFLLECYPLHAMFPHCDLGFAPAPHDRSDLPVYRVETNGGSVEIAVPVRWRELPDGTEVLANCGWVINTAGQSKAMLTDFEEIFDAACHLCQELPLVPLSSDAPDGPYFERLEFAVSLPADDHRLQVGHEVISLREVMHEEIYFAALDVFRHRLGLEPGSRKLKCGQLVPLITCGAPSILVRHLSPGQDRTPDVAPPQALDKADHWLSPYLISSELLRLGGTAYSCHSRQGRTVEGQFVEGRTAAALAISAGQHPNETSPMVGALRAARRLADAGEISFTINPLENPDGYALFRELCADNPQHMHHAARYTASGADLGQGERGFENEIRTLAKQHLRADVHVNLHGYPAHEWTRPLSGYIPPGFEQWTIPKGFFLILRHDPQYRVLAEAVLKVAATALADFPALAAQNRQMLNRYLRYVDQPDFQLMADCVPYIIRPSADADYPVTLITEAADETIYGADFQVAQEGQFRVVMAVAELLQTRTGPGSPIAWPTS